MKTLLLLLIAFLYIQAVFGRRGLYSEIPTQTFASLLSKNIQKNGECPAGAYHEQDFAIDGTPISTDPRVCNSIYECLEYCKTSFPNAVGANYYREYKTCWCFSSVTRIIKVEGYDTAPTVCSQSSLCTDNHVIDGYYRKGAMLAGSPYSLDTPIKCCQMCIREAGCVAWSYDSLNKWCFLYPAVSPLKPNPLYSKAGLGCTGC